MTERNPDACHISCGDTFSWYNNSIFFCQKGCDYALGKVYDPATRIDAENLCKKLAQDTMLTKKDELENIKDLRVHSDMFPVTPKKIYKACLAGVRRQKY